MEEQKVTRSFGKGREGDGTICEEDKGTEGTLFGKSQSFDRNLPPSPLLLPSVLEKCKCAVFPGDWPAGASLEFCKLAICHPIINDTYKGK